MPVAASHRDVDAPPVTVGPTPRAATPACRGRMRRGVVEDAIRDGDVRLSDRIGEQSPALLGWMERRSTHGSRARCARLSLGNFHIACRL